MNYWPIVTHFFVFVTNKRGKDKDNNRGNVFFSYMSPHILHKDV